MTLPKVFFCRNQKVIFFFHLKMEIVVRKKNCVQNLWIHNFCFTSVFQTLFIEMVFYYLLLKCFHWDIIIEMFILVKELLKMDWHCLKFSLVEIGKVIFFFNLEDRNCWLGKKKNCVQNLWLHDFVFTQCFRPGWYQVHNNLKLSIIGIWN